MRQLHLARNVRGFTLIEITLTVVVIAVLLAVAIPHFLTARDRAQTKNCLTNLSHIAHAKEQLTGEEKLNNGDTVDWNDLVPGFLKTVPSCPASGNYSIGIVGVDPACSVIGHALP